MNEIGVFISNVGFPIALVCIMVYGIYSFFKSVFERFLKPVFERFLNTLDAITETNKILVSTNSILADKLDKKMDQVLVEVMK